MNLSQTPIANRFHIAFFGCVNAGKSSLINAFLGQNVSIVSSKKGTTTDPVKKTMELVPYGPVVAIDTAGLDDESELGILRQAKTNEILDKTDIAIVVIDSLKGINKKDIEIIEKLKTKNIPYIVAYNKSDLSKEALSLKENEIIVSAVDKTNISSLKEMTGKLIEKIKKEKNKPIITDKISSDDTIILVIPIDESAPKGRLILPQQMVLKELLENHNSVICVQPEQLKQILNNLKTKPKLVITDSQVFNKIKDIVDSDIFLTSFSILFARYKGELETLIKGIEKLSDLQNGANILISEGCTHHRQCNDIGSVKIPNWIQKHTNKTFNFEFSSGGEFSQNIEKYDLIIHCGGCMLNEKEMKIRIEKAKEKNVSIINYGILIAHINGILSRSLEIFY